MPIQEFTLADLAISPLNARKTRTAEAVEAMAASIKAQGVLQPLVVHPMNGSKTMGVAIGGTRFEALQLLLKRKEIEPDYKVLADVREENEAALREASLTENVVRTAMHPADEFTAFAALAADGHGPAEIGSRFGQTGRYVEQRMKLAAVSPKLLAVFRKGEMTLDQVEAMTVTDNHRQQEKIWRELPDWQKEQGDGEAIRDQLTEKHIDAARDSLAKFVTVAAYEAAGGGVARDLFADESQPGYLTDAKLLTRLADEKLKAIAEPFKAEGWKWVEIKPDFDWTEQQKFGRVNAALTKEQKAEIAALERQQEELYEEHGDENLPPKLEAKSIEIEQQLDAIRGEVAFTLAQKALAGVVITIGHKGQAEIKRGLVKPEDKRAAAKAEATEKPGKPKAKGEETEITEPGLSAALVENLTAHRTAALQAKLATNPKVALVAVTHALALSVLERSGYSTVQITGREPNLTAAGEELGKTPAAKEFAAATREATKGMPRESGKLWTWLMQQDQRRVLSILAVAAAHSVDAVQRKFNGADRAHADQLATALKLDMASYWQATAEGFFSRVSKDQTLAAVTEAAGEATAKGMAGMKKAELATAAEKATKGKGWLPAILQNG
jgi:ParB family transcriptional regulator, chromosome partitioning protein